MSELIFQNEKLQESYEQLLTYMTNNDPPEPELPIRIKPKPKPKPKPKLKLKPKYNNEEEKL